jgi:hypothetical protein
MPPKGPSETTPTTPKKLKSESDPIPPITSSPKKTSSPWSNSEEKKFLEAIDKIVKLNLWAELKGDDEVGKRGANGVRSHWDAMVSILSSLPCTSYRHPSWGWWKLMISIRR